MRFGYFLSCEEYSPAQLVEQAVAAEAGRLRRAVDQRPLPPVERRAGPEPVRLVGDRRAVPGVLAARDHGGHLSDDCGSTRRWSPRPRPPPRVHARRAGSSLGVGTGEALNEHVLGDAWPSADVRLEMLEEAVEVMRELWTGDVVTTGARHYDVDHGPDLHAAGRAAAGLRLGVRPEGASTWPRRIGDGFITTSRRRRGGRVVQGASRAASPAQAGVKVACADSRGRGRRPRAPAVGRTPDCPASWPRCSRAPQHFEQASQLVTRESTADSVVAGNDPTDARGALPRRTSTPATTRCTSRTWARTTLDDDRGIRPRRPAAAAPGLGPRSPERPGTSRSVTGRSPCRWVPRHQEGA